MSKYVLPIAFCFSALTCLIANAQNLCPAGVASDKLICLIPQVYGVNGLEMANPDGAGQVQTNVLTVKLRPLDSAIAKQVALLPLASPSSGFTYSWDSGSKTFLSTTDSFGPIFSERAETVGRHRVFLGVTYQYFRFSSLDGVGLKEFPVVLTQQDDTIDVPGRTCSFNGDNTTDCNFIRDVVRTSNRIDFKIHQFTSFVTFGLTNRIDISVAIPIENVRLGMYSGATIVRNENPVQKDHAFPPRDDCPATCLFRPFSSVESASGIGDISLRVKGTAWKGERAALALGVDVRLPTGDQLNFLGAGAAGVRPFFVWSYRPVSSETSRQWWRRISPHVFVGYEANGSSVLAGDISTGQKERLPSQLTYSGGADVWLTHWFTAAFDLVGQEVFQARRTSVTTFIEPGPCDNFACQNPGPSAHDPDLAQVTGSYNATNASVGWKVRPVAGLLITGNALIKLNEGGLRANVIPLVGISYTF